MSSITAKFYKSGGSSTAAVGTTASSAPSSHAQPLAREQRSPAAGREEGGRVGKVGGGERVEEKERPGGEEEGGDEGWDEEEWEVHVRGGRAIVFIS